MKKIEKELKCITDFLNEVADHYEVDRWNIVEACRDAIHRLDLDTLYDQFRGAALDLDRYELDGRVVRRVADLGDQ